MRFPEDREPLAPDNPLDASSERHWISPSHALLNDVPRRPAGAQIRAHPPIDPGHGWGWCEVLLADMVEQTNLGLVGQTRHGSADRCIAPLLCKLAALQ